MLFETVESVCASTGFSPFPFVVVTVVPPLGFFRGLVSDSFMFVGRAGRASQQQQGSPAGQEEKADKEKLTTKFVVIVIQFELDSHAALKNFQGVIV